MPEKLLKPLILVCTLLFTVHLFHHDIAEIWHTSVHIMHAEDHHHSHEFLSHTNHHTTIPIENTHHYHQLIDQFMNSFELASGLAKEGDLPIVLNTEVKHSQKNTINIDICFNSTLVHFDNFLNLYNTPASFIDAPPPKA